MSNVLIGIIGVILFIGLAIAGAVYLGDDFMSASSDSRAAASVTQIAQVSAAIQMYEMKTGTNFAAGTSLSTLVPRFLKSIPINPTTGPAPDTYTSQVVNSGGRTSIILMELGTKAAAVCSAIAAQNGMSAVPIANDVASVPTNSGGCFKTSAVVGSARASTYYAYNRTWGPTASSGSGGGLCYQAGNGTGGTQTNCPAPVMPVGPVKGGGGMQDCWYVDPANPDMAVHGYCDANGVPITGGN
jgi:hypothetical protein